MTAHPFPSPMLSSLVDAHNFRNLAGMRSIDGRRIAANVLYRSAGLYKLTPDAWAELLRAGLRTICDLRSEQESALAPTAPPPGNQLQILAFDIRNDVRSDPHLLAMLAAEPDAAGARRLMLEIYRRFPSAFAPRLKMLFDAASEGGAPMLLHCAAGKDRTGFAVALLLHALGVSKDEIMKDYMLSRQSLGCADPRIPGLQAMFQKNAGLDLPAAAVVPILDVEPAYLDTAFEVLERDHGGADVWLQAVCGLTSIRRERLRANMLAA